MADEGCILIRGFARLEVYIVILVCIRVCSFMGLIGKMFPERLNVPSSGKAEHQ